MSDLAEMQALSNGDNDAWRRFLDKSTVRVRRMVQSRLGGGSQKIDELTEEICQETVLKFIEKLNEGTINASAGRFFMGVASKMFYRSLNRTKGAETQMKSQTDYRTPSLPVREAEEYTILRRRLRQALEDLRAELMKEAQKPRISRRHAPFLNLLVIDQFAFGGISLKELRQACRLPDDSEASRLRKSAWQRFQNHCLENDVECWSFDDSASDPFRALREAWTVGLHGCDTSQSFPHVHPSHDDDLRCHERAHRELACCPLCVDIRTDSEEAGAAALVRRLLETTRDSLTSMNS